MAIDLFSDKAALAGFCKQHRIQRLALFGSQLKGTASADSEVDLLTEFEPGCTPGLLGMSELEIELSEMLGQTVDLRTAGRCRPTSGTMSCAARRFNMQSDDRVRLLHMVDACKRARAFVAGRDRADLDSDQMLHFALVRAIEIIGEAASKVCAVDRSRILELVAFGRHRGRCPQRTIGRLLPPGVQGWAFRYSLPVRPCASVSIWIHCGREHLLAYGRVRRLACRLERQRGTNPYCPPYPLCYGSVVRWR